MRPCHLYVHIEPKCRSYHFTRHADALLHDPHDASIKFAWAMAPYSYVTRANLAPNHYVVKFNAAPGESPFLFVLFRRLPRSADPLTANAQSHSRDNYEAIKRLFAYDYEAMRRANAPLREELLRVVMSPHNVSRLPSLGLL